MITEAQKGIFASARDISEQARLQTLQVERQAYNRSLIEASAEALFAIAPDGTITDVNEEATRLTGYCRKHLINSRFWEYFTEPDRARAGVLQTLREQRAIGCELVPNALPGRRITVSFNAGVFKDASGESLGILAAAREITEPKKLEEELRNWQFYTRTLIESNIDAPIANDPLGIITDVNLQMESLTGYSGEELIGVPFKQFFTLPAAGGGRYSPGAARGAGDELRTDRPLQDGAGDCGQLQRYHVLRQGREVAGETVSVAKILVVDDRPTNREFLVALLGYAGPRVLEAAGGAEALEVAKAERPDLAIAEMVMPAMDGFEFVRQLRSYRAGAQTRVIFYTAVYQQQKAHDKARACGVSCILSKPCDPEVLLGAVGGARRPHMAFCVSVCGTVQSRALAPAH